MLFTAEGEKEKLALEKFQSKVQDLKQNEETLLRFLRAREHNVEKAEEMLRTSMKWREERNFGSVLTWTIPKVIEDDHFYSWCGKDNENRPVMYLPMGSWNTRQLIQSGLKNEIIDFVFFLLESIAHKLKEENCSQATFIYGMEDLTMWKIANLDTMQILFNAFQDLEANYPEIIKTIYVINGVLINMLRAEKGKEKTALITLKSKVKDLNQTEETLLRFLRARDNNVVKAEDMLRKAISWRREKNIESYLLWQPSKELLNDFSYKFTGFALDGSPVIYFPWGKYDGRVWVEQGRKEELIKLIYHILETVMQRLKESKCSQVVSIFAMEELTMRKMTHLETMQLVYGACQEMENYYPEIIKEIFVVNAPMIFSFGFNCIKSILSSHSLAKLHVFNSNRKKWLKALQEKLPKEAIPEEYLENDSDENDTEEEANI